MEKVRKDGTLLHEVSVDYRNFGRDNFRLGASVFIIMMVIGLIIGMGWFFSVLTGFAAMVSVLLDSFFFKQLFKFSFNDKEQKVVVTYSRYMFVKEVEIDFESLRYNSSREFLGKGYDQELQLKIYEGKRLLFKVSKRKYGWTDGLVQEAIKMLKYRNVNDLK